MDENLKTYWYNNVDPKKVERVIGRDDDGYLRVIIDGKINRLMCTDVQYLKQLPRIVNDSSNIKINKTDKIINDKSDKNLKTENLKFNIGVSYIITYRENDSYRKKNLEAVLNYISKLKLKNFEIILVEQDIIEKFDCKKYEKVKKIFLYNNGIFNKSWGYNVGALNSKYDYLIFGDSDIILPYKFIINSLTLFKDFDVINPYQYIYYYNEKITQKLINSNFYKSNINIEKQIQPGVISGCIFMIKKLKYLDLKGFDEDCSGFGYEDDIFDIKFKLMDYKIKRILNQFCYHLYHPLSNSEYYSNKDKNKKLFSNYIKFNKNDLIDKLNNIREFGNQNKVKIERGLININKIENKRIINYNKKENNNLIPKQIFFYWSGGKISWMRYMTLFSFRKFNPDWKITLYISNNIKKNKDWSSVDEQDFHRYIGDDYYNKLKDLNINIEKAEFPEEVKNKIRNISPIHESDLFRYYQLYKNGGLYCDMDVLFFRPIDEFYDNIVFNEYDTIVHEYTSTDKKDWWLTIGFLGASINNEYFKDLFENGIETYVNYNNFNNSIDYQSMGVLLTYKMLNIKPYNYIWDKLINNYPNLKIYNLDTNLIYNFDWTKIKYCYNNSLKINDFKDIAIGYHWFGGNVISQKYNNLLNEKTYKSFNTTFSAISDEVINMKIEEKKLDKKSISIVTTYYNRKKLFYETLKSISKSKFKDFELIAVDDCSSPEERLEEYINEFDFLKIIRLEKKDKWYVNPCIPFNIGIQEAIGDIIILQNPECLHVHDVLTYVKNNIDDKTYITMSTYSLNDKNTKELHNCLNNKSLLTYFKSLPQESITPTSINGWYNHSIYRPTYYHFCSAITKKNIEELNGFDQRYANGIAFDDDEFIERIKRLRLNMIIQDDISVIHQYHPTVYYSIPNYMKLHDNNKLIFENMTKKEKTIKVNI